MILGAALDTRAYRLPGVEAARAFEVDLPGVQAVKKKRLEKRFGRREVPFPPNSKCTHPSIVDKSDDSMYNKIAGP